MGDEPVSDVHDEQHPVSGERLRASPPTTHHARLHHREAASQLVDAAERPFRVSPLTGRGPFRFAVLDSRGELRDAFRSQRSAEHAARMLALGAGYDRHAVLGARVRPLSDPSRVRDASEPPAAVRIRSGSA